MNRTFSSDLWIFDQCYFPGEHWCRIFTFFLALHLMLGHLTHLINWLPKPDNFPLFGTNVNSWGWPRGNGYYWNWLLHMKSYMYITTQLHQIYDLLYILSNLKCTLPVNLHLLEWNYLSFEAFLQKTFVFGWILDLLSFGSHAWIVTWPCVGSLGWSGGYWWPISRKQTRGETKFWNPLTPWISKYKFSLSPT